MRDSILACETDPAPGDDLPIPDGPSADGVFEACRYTSPRPDARRADAVCQGRAVRVEVMQDVVEEGTRIVVFVGATAASEPRRIEYITAYSGLDEALNEGLDVARAIVAGRRNQRAV